MTIALESMQRPIHHDSKKILLSNTITNQELEDGVKAIINSKFADKLTIGKSPGQTKWIVRTRNVSFIYGFSILYENKTIVLAHALNTWSLWAEDYIRESLARNINAKIGLKNGKQIDPDPEAIGTFLSWLRTVADDQEHEKVSKFYLYQMNRIPSELKSIDTNYSLG